MAEKWSPTITPQGAYRCEVMASMDRALGLGIGLPVEPGWWELPIEAFAGQITACCPLCGVCVPNLPGRLDIDNVDDISPAALAAFADSPRVQRGEFVRFDPASYEVRPPDPDHQPERYITATRRGGGLRGDR